MGNGLVDRAATGIGVVSTVAGIALLTAPERAGSALGIGPHRPMALALGAADVAVGAGLLSGQARSRWLAARASVNLPVVAAMRREARHSRGRDAERSRRAATGLLAITCVDTTLAVLARAGA